VALASLVAYLLSLTMTQLIGGASDDRDQESEGEAWLRRQLEGLGEP